MTEACRVVASIVIDLLPDGCVRISSLCGERPDSRYVPLGDDRVSGEVQKLLTELRERLCTISKEVGHG